MRLSKIKAVAITFLALNSLSAYAIKTGPYFGGRLGYAEMGDFSDATSQNNGAVKGAMIGYNITKNFGLEVSYDVLPNTDYVLNNFNYYSTVLAYKMQTINYVMKGYLPLETQIPTDIYAIAGVARADVDVTNKHTNYSESYHSYVARFGFGLNLQMTEHLSGAVELIANGAQSGNDEHVGIPQTSIATFNLLYNF